MKIFSIPFPHAYKIVVACCAITITGLSIPINCGGLFYKPASEALNVGLGALSLYLTIQYIVTALFLPLAGKLMAGQSAKLILICAIVLDSAAFACLGYANGVWWFYISGFFMGLAGAILIFLAVPVLITNWFAGGTGAALGIALAAGGVASAIFSPIINFLITAWSWRVAYAICGLAMAIIALPVCLRVVQMKPETIGLKPWGKAETQTDAQRCGVPFKICIHLPLFYIVFLFAGLLGITSALIIHIPPYMQEIGLSPLSVSSVLSAVVIGVTCGMFGVGWLNDKLGMGLSVALGICAGLIGMLLLFVGDNINLGLAGGFCYGAGSATTLVAPPLVVKNLFGMKEYSQIYAWITTAVALGAAFGVSLFGFIRDFAANYSASMFVGMALQFSALMFFLLACSLKKRSRNLWR